MTLRETTERPITVEIGTNRLVKMEEVLKGIDQVLRKKWPRGRRPELWDGKTATRVVANLAKLI